MSIYELQSDLSCPCVPQAGMYDEPLSSFFRNIDTRSAVVVGPYNNTFLHLLCYSCLLVSRTSSEIPLGNGRGKIGALKARVWRQCMAIYFPVY